MIIILPIICPHGISESGHPAQFCNQVDKLKKYSAVGRSFAVLFLVGDMDFVVMYINVSSKIFMFGIAFVEFKFE